MFGVFLLVYLSTITIIYCESMDLFIKQATEKSSNQKTSSQFFSKILKNLITSIPVNKTAHVRVFLQFNYSKTQP